MKLFEDLKKAVSLFNKVSESGTNPFDEFFEKDLREIFHSKKARKNLERIAKLELDDTSYNNIFAERKWYITQQLKEDFLKVDRIFLALYSNLHAIYKARLWIHNNGQEFNFNHGISVIAFCLQNAGYTRETESDEKWFVNTQRLLVIEEIRTMIKVTETLFGEHNMLNAVKDTLAKFKMANALTATAFYSEVKQAYNELNSLGGIFRMDKLVIFFDADDVLVDSSLPAVERYNQKYGENLGYEDLINYVDDKFFPTDKSIEEPYYGEPGFFREFKPFPGAQNLIRKLSEDGHELYIATASKLSVIADKISCYDEHFPEFNSRHRNVIPIFNKSLLQGSVIIDDMPYNLVNSLCPLRLLMDRPWNRKAEGNFIRCYSYDDIYVNIQKYIAERG